MPTVYLSGKGGKMGKALLHELEHHDTFELSTSLQDADLIIDFSHPQATTPLLLEAFRYKKPLVIGTTGLSSEQQMAIQKASQSIPILLSANFSIGIALCLQTLPTLCQALPPDCTITIEETHHTAKKDSPSGTSLLLSHATGKRQEVSINSVRTGNVVGEHVIRFSWGTEQLELKHEALSRACFAQGALRGALFLLNQPPGLYTLTDALIPNEANN